MSPFFNALPTVAEARSNAVRSGRRALSIGVGTVTMKKSALDSSAGSKVKTTLERARSSGSTSQVRSRPALSSEMRPASMSKPMTRVPDISKTDDGELATVLHDLPLTKAPMRIGLSYPAHSQWTNSRRLLEQASIERNQVAADTLARERPLDQFAAGLAELVPQLRIACEP